MTATDDQEIREALNGRMIIKMTNMATAETAARQEQDTDRDQVTITRVMTMNAGIKIPMVLHLVVAETANMMDMADKIIPLEMNPATVETIMAIAGIPTTADIIMKTMSDEVETTDTARTTAEGMIIATARIISIEALMTTEETTVVARVTEIIAIMIGKSNIAIARGIKTSTIEAAMVITTDTKTVEEAILVEVIPVAKMVRIGGKVDQEMISNIHLGSGNNPKRVQPTGIRLTNLIAIHAIDIRKATPKAIVQNMRNGESEEAIAA